jgi:hypothetical protein
MAQLASMMDLSFLGTYAFYGDMVPALDCAGSRRCVRKGLAAEAQRSPEGCDLQSDNPGSGSRRERAQQAMLRISPYCVAALEPVG